jgi:hypothetical protein
MKSRFTPLVIWVALGIYGIAFAMYLATNGLFGLLALPMIIFQLFFLAKVRRQRLWARYALATLLIIMLWRAWLQIAPALETIESAHLVVATILGLATPLLEIIAVVLLFTPVSSRWLREGSSQPNADVNSSECAPPNWPSFVDRWPIVTGILVAGLPAAAVHWLVH